MVNQSPVRMISKPIRTTDDQFIDPSVVGFVVGKEKMTTRAVTANGAKMLQK